MNLPFFAVKAYVPGGVQNQAEKNSNNAFRPVPVQKFTFPVMGCFPVDFQDVKRPLRTKSVKRPIKVGKRPINEGKRPIKAKVLVGVSVGSLMGCFRAPPPWRKTAPLKRPIKRSMKNAEDPTDRPCLDRLSLGARDQFSLSAMPFGRTEGITDHAA